MIRLYRKALRLTFFRNWISILRSVWLLKIKRVKIKTFEAGEDVHKPTIFSNKRRIVSNKSNPHPTAKYFLGVDKEQAGSKSDLLIYPLKSIDRIRKTGFPKLKVLSIGPRTEGEILNLVSHGFKIKNISALDLMSYSPWIEVGDMHDMPFEDNSFDIVICGWVIAYSNNKEKAASEITRVLKNNGVASIGVSYSPSTNEEVLKKRGYLVATEDRLMNTNAVLTLFGEKVGQIHFRNDIDEDLKNRHGQIITILSVQK